MEHIILEFNEKEVISVPKLKIGKIKICNHCGRILYKTRFYNKRMICKDCYKYRVKLRKLINKERIKENE